MKHPEVTLANDFLGAWFRVLQNPFIFNYYRMDRIRKQAGKSKKKREPEVSLAKSNRGLRTRS